MPRDEAAKGEQPEALAEGVDTYSFEIEQFARRVVSGHPSNPADLQALAQSIYADAGTLQAALADTMAKARLSSD